LQQREGVADDVGHEAAPHEEVGELHLLHPSGREAKRLFVLVGVTGIEPVTSAV
jgi:hypothetical protein